MLVYIHLPLCRRKCRYCAFPSWEYREDAAARIVDLIVADVARWGGREALTARTLYLGGGTPSLWPIAELGRIVDAVARYLNLPGDVEVTVEANPESALHGGWLKGLASLGVTRISLGVQSFHDALLAFLGRPHDGLQAQKAVEAAVTTGLAVNVDLLWNIPGQTRALWAADVAQAVSLGVSHVSCYALTPEPGTPLAQVQLSWPSEEDAAAQYELACVLLESHGLRQYEFANWALPGQECQHNLGYWRGEDYLGFGPGAVSTWRGERWTNPGGVEDYAAVVAGERCPLAEALTAQVVAQERLMLGLRTREGIDLLALGRAVGVDLLNAGGDVWHSLVQAGLAQLDAGWFWLTRQGMLVGNAVSAHLLAHFDSWVRQGAKTMEAR